MTSAVLAGRNEVHHAHPDHSPLGGLRGDSLKPKPSIPPPNHRRHRPGPNPNPIPGPPALPWHDPAPSAAPPPSALRRVTIRPAGMSRLEARQAQARLTGELGRVRALLARIDAWQGGPRRGAAPGPRHASPAPPSLRAAMLKRCGQILTRLRRQRASHWFKAPVDVEGLKLHNYRDIIRNPMDLGTVKENLAGARYPSHEEFAADVRLTFSNALRYNEPGLQVHTAAGNLLASFEGMYREAVSWFEQEFQRLEQPVPLTLPPPPQQPVQVLPRMGGGRRPKPPKAREPNKREMNAEEKEKLREEIENLPYDQIDNVLQILQKRNSDLALRGEEVELDFDVMDAETLWELDQFVANLRKACDKSRRNVAVNGDAAVVSGVMVDVAVVPDEDDMVQLGVNPPIAVEIGDSVCQAEAMSMAVVLMLCHVLTAYFRRLACWSRRQKLAWSMSMWILVMRCPL
jgi:hypothetical protein